MKVNNNTYVSLGLVITIITMVLALATNWGRTQAIMQSKLDKADAAKMYATREDLDALRQDIGKRLDRLDQKLDELMRLQLSRRNSR